MANKPAKTENRTTPADKRVAVIWTRVSCFDQTNNLSLGVQERACLEYADRNGIQVDKIMGQTNESAKTEGKLYHEMIAYVSSHRVVNTILVYSFDRFSRAGAEAIVTKAFLKSKGITVISITQPIDSDNMAGEFMENMIFLFNQFENNLRRSKCNAGMLASLERGDWYTKPPVGYKIDRTAKEKHRFIFDETYAPLIRDAFHWKAEEGLSDSEIQHRLHERGWKIERSRIPLILHNPFYVGKLKHNMLGDRIVKGNQPALIDEETFNIANGMHARIGHEQTELIPTVPLRKHVRCVCGRYMTGYIVKKKNLWYYKCNTIGCGSNISAKELHRLYTEFLEGYSLPADFSPILKVWLRDCIASYYSGLDNEIRSLTANRAELRRQRREATTRYGVGSIPKEVYKITCDNLDRKLMDLEQSIENLQIKKSNPITELDKLIAIACNLPTYWNSAAPENKVKFQNILFPAGVSFSKNSGFNRTTEVNSAIEIFHLFSDTYRKFQETKKEKPEDFSFSVARRGIEPRFKV